MAQNDPWIPQQKIPTLPGCTKLDERKLNLTSEEYISILGNKHT